MVSLFGFWPDPPPFLASQPHSRLQSLDAWILFRFTSTLTMPLCVCVCARVHARSVSQSDPTICDPMVHSPPGSSVHGDSPGKNTGVGCHFLLQGIFPTQGWNPRLLTPVSSALQVDLLSFKPFEECCKNINRREEKCSP